MENGVNREILEIRKKSRSVSVSRKFGVRVFGVFRGSKNSLAGDLGLCIPYARLMNATDSALKWFGNTWKFRKAQGSDVTWKVYGHLAEFVPEKAICQSIIQQCSELTRS